MKRKTHHTSVLSNESLFICVLTESTVKFELPQTMLRADGTLRVKQIVLVVRTNVNEAAFVMRDL